MQTRMIGFFLVLAGLMLFIVEAGYANVKSLVSWSFALALVGIIMIFVSFLKSQSQLTLFGGVFTTIGIFAWGYSNIPTFPHHWSVIVLMLGIVLLLQYLVGKNSLSAIIGVMMLLIGFFANPVITKIALFHPIAHALNTYWPALIIVLGVIFLFRK